MKTTISEFFSGLLFSLPGFLIFAKLNDLLEKLGMELAFGGDKAAIFWGLFLGLPLGNILGFMMIDKFYNKVEACNISGIIMGFVFGLLGNFAGVYLLDIFGGKFLFVIPILITFLCLCGYKINYR